MTYTHHMNLDEQNVALVIKDTAGEVSKFNWPNTQTNKQTETNYLVSLFVHPEHRTQSETVLSFWRPDLHSVLNHGSIFVHGGETFGEIHTKS